MMISINAQDTQLRLGDLLDHLPAGVVVQNTDGTILHANHHACELIGWSEEHLRGLNPAGGIWSFVRADGSPMSPEEFPSNLVLRTGLPVFQLVFGVEAKEHEIERWIICNAYPEFDSNDMLCRVVVCFTDCTALKQAEQNRHESEQRLRLALLGSTDARWDYDLVKDKIYYSERWWSMLGYRPGELESTTSLWLERMHPDDRSDLVRSWYDLLAGPSNTYSIEWRLQHRDGHYVSVLSRGFVIRDANGTAIRVSGTNDDLTERRYAEQRIYELENFDHLTALPNRRLLLEELDKALARSQDSGSIGALILLDLDNFKLLKSTMGHVVGDMLLQQIAERLRRTLRPGDQLARLGGDEFVLILENLGDDTHTAVKETQQLLVNLRSILDLPYFLNDRLFLSTLSMGVTLFDGLVPDMENLLKQADLAMYRAKSDGRNVIRFFDPGMQAAAEHQANMEHAMREGLSAHHFVLFCQPQFCNRGRLVGAEVLVRWRRADGQLLGPDEFIGLAESSGLIAPLGQYVLEESCRALARWRDDSVLRTLELGVNISAHQLRRTDFSGKVSDILRNTDAPPEKLCLELTESTFAENVDEVIQHMQALRSQGVRFSLDDFGTGYSSLAYLKRFPLSALKIDRSFTHDVHLDSGAAPIVDAIIAMAHSLNLDIVAEGVEHEAQRRVLIDGGCGVLQGYLLGRPLPILEFERRFGSATIGNA